MEPIDYMRIAGKLASQTLDYIEPFVVVGITTDEINTLVHEFTIDNGAIPAPLGYHGFPKSVCTSLNNVVCHGIPSDIRLRDGDIINIDVTPTVDGWHGDTSRTFFVGKPSIKAKKLVEVTYDAMMVGIAQIKPGATTGDIGYAIEQFVNGRYGIVREYCGHGLGQTFHTSPQIFHWGTAGTGETLKEGMFITVEPMLNIGKDAVKTLSDKWTVVTKGGVHRLSAQFEHTIAVVEDGYEILTISGDGK
jgi:methionyl aminopeptidase